MIEWKYLEGALLRLGFQSRFVSKVIQLVKSVSFSILVNGAHTPYFRPSRGLRQGDPLSPFLFLLATEGLSALIQNEVELGRIQGLKISRQGPVVSHLLYADETIIFAKSSMYVGNRI